MKRSVFGYVGPEALPKSLPPEVLKLSLKALRDNVEECLESQFHVFAQLAVSESGSVHVAYTGDADQSENEKILSCAIKCATDFTLQNFQS